MTDDRILFVDLSRRYGGSGVRAITLAEAFGPERAGLACLSGSEPAQEARQRDLRLHTLATRKSDPRLAIQLARLVKEHGYIVMDTQGPPSKFWGTFAAMLSKCTLVSTLNSWYAQEHGGKLRGRLYQGFERISARRTDAFVCVAQEILDKLSHWNYPKDRCFLVPNGLPEQLPVEQMDRQSCRHLFNIPEDAVCLAAVGRLVHAKGYAYLLDALSLMRRSDAYLIIVGGGHLEKDLKEQIKRQGYGDRVILAGMQPQGRSLAIMNAADVYVLSSVTEGLPFVLLEASILGKPIVATQVGHIPDTFRNDVEALLVPPENPAALAQAMDTLIEDRAFAECLGSNARSAVLSRFGVEATLEGCERVYTAACKHRKGLS